MEMLGSVVNGIAATSTLRSSSGSVSVRKTARGGPGVSVRLPISPGVIFRRVWGMGGVDLRDLRGWRVVAPGSPPEGFAIDGAMDDVERAFAADGTWFVLAHDRDPARDAGFCRADRGGIQPATGLR